MQKPTEHPYLTEDADNVSASSGSDGDPTDVSPSSSQQKCPCGVVADDDDDVDGGKEDGELRWWRAAAADPARRSPTGPTQTEAVHNKAKALVWDNSYFFSHKNSPPPRRAEGDEGARTGDAALTRGEVLTWMEKIKTDDASLPPTSATMTQTPPRAPSPAGPPPKKSPWHPYGGDSADACAPPRRTPSVASSSHSDTRPPRRPSEDGNIMAAVWVDMPRTPPSTQPEHHRRRTPRRSSGPPSPCASTLTASFASSNGGDGSRARVTVVASSAPMPGAAPLRADELNADAVVLSPMSPAPTLTRAEPVSLTPPSHVVLDQPLPPPVPPLPVPVPATKDALLQEMLDLYRASLSRIGALETEVAQLRQQLRDGRGPAAWTAETTTTNERVQTTTNVASLTEPISSASSSDSSLEGDLLSTEIEGGCGVTGSREATSTSTAAATEDADTLQRLVDAVQRAKQRTMTSS